MESLKDIFDSHEGRLIHKWTHYIEVYDSFFNKYRGKEIVFLEIGIAHGGSLQMWRRYFGEKATIIGVDVNPECKKFEEPGTQIFIGSQEDSEFLSSLKTKIPKVDILLDDGGHTMNQQIVTFNYLFDHIKENGIYACEDLHTSYWPEYGGGFKRKSSFIEFSKNFIDNIHGWHARNKRSKMFNSLTESIFSIHYYDSIILLQKRKMPEPQHVIKGQKQLEDHFLHYGQKRNYLYEMKMWLKRKLK